MKHLKLISLLAIIGVLSSSCALLDVQFDNLSRSLSGVEATMSTYDQEGRPIDRVTSTAMDIGRESEFDTTNSDGFSNADSSVLRVSVGDNLIRHVGSTMIVVETGINEVAGVNSINITNVEPGRPWLNDLFAKSSNAWKGSSKTLMIRSQDGLPIAVFAGDQVELFKTDIEKSTQFQIDGKFLFVYRADYTLIDTALLEENQ